LGQVGVDSCAQQGHVDTCGGKDQVRFTQLSCGGARRGFTGVAAPDVRQALKERDMTSVGCGGHVGVDQCVGDQAGLAGVLREPGQQPSSSRQEPGLGVVGNQGGHPQRPSIGRDQRGTVQGWNPVGGAGRW